ncbi:MAG: EAL domain-containing protein [Gammaproteobacteria bacterium]|jgi:diguanylate cyclase (GGDEF)-like protein|nr:EAL domain-containing protein [Gammaproteobacteria bacterium]MDP6617220.1 EAL domain-containing protein [Gammaproteobacteria bacterium]MDP6695807.1 EAL domain-containing protein [Gammaproteobacteria bacterium]MDP7041229.1 EAL domain-containing protein [Gammaproteobacteria bacterium]
MRRTDTPADLTARIRRGNQHERWSNVPDLASRLKNGIPDTRVIFRALKSAKHAIQNFFRRRSLLGEILLLQLLFAIVAGSLAFGALWLSSSRAAADNMRNWGEQWLSTLDEISMPLYVAQDDERHLQVEEYVHKFPEISFVRFYSDSGELVFENYQRVGAADVDPLPVETLQGLVNTSRDDQRYLLDTATGDMPLTRIGKPIWTEALMMDGLIGLDLSDDSAVEKTLVGFVELGLNSSAYQEALTRTIRSGTLWGALLLVLLTTASWLVYRRALLPLSHLQAPLKKLAKGHTDFKVETAGHTEIVAIADALNTTVTALNERDKKLWHLANHDSLTGLVNRHRFSEILNNELAQLEDTDGTSALLFIDLDQFKYVNDTVGHAAGDRLLQDVAERLTDAVRQTDTVSRFGGDEFVVLLSDVCEKQVKVICEDLIRSASEYRFVENEQSFSVRCSIGVTMIWGNEFTPADLLSQADMACHHAKSLGRNRFDFYQSASRSMAGMVSEVGLSRQIQQALSNDTFVLYFQPIVDISTRQPTHYEVLLRMRGNKNKLVLPDTFMPAATRFGLMVDIDRWVIRNALEQIAEIRMERPDTCFTLNVSGNMFETPDFVEFIKMSLKKTGVPMEAIVLEITEQVAVRTAGNSGRRITKLAKLGCKFALDDFGAGYSSYSYLKTLPVDYIKIDGSFIKNIASDIVDQKIVGSIIEIARATGKQTIAEHVADYETFTLLSELGIDFAQGNFLGKPGKALSSEAIPTSISEAKKKRRRKAGQAG